MRRIFASLLVVLALAPSVLWANPSKGEVKSPTVLRFVTYAKERPSEEFRKMEPFQRHLEGMLVERGFRVRVDLIIHATYDEAHDAIAAGQFEFGRLGPAGYLIVKARRAPVRILVAESYNGTSLFEGAIFVRDDSPIRTLADIKGKRMAFGDDKSTTGRFLPQATLVRAGIRARDLKAFDYLGRHDKVVTAIASGAFDVGAANDRTIEKHTEKKLRKIAKVTTPTEPWVVHAGVDPKLADAIRDALLTMDRKALQYLDRDGFVPAREADFEALEREMKQAEQFGG